MRKIWFALLAFTVALGAIAGAAHATVPSTSSSAGPYAGGSTGPFSVPFRFLEASHLEVVCRTGTNDTTLALTTDYTVANSGTVAGGSVTLVAASRCPGGSTLTVKRVVPLTQGTSFRSQGNYAASSHENAFDKATMALQQVDRRVADEESARAAGLGAEANERAAGDAAVHAAAAASAAAAAASAIAAASATAWQGSISVMRPPFNAACDGVTDDRAAIQAALDAANAAGGGHVLIPASTAISSALIIHSNTWLDVAPGATVKFRPGATGNLLRNAAFVAQRTVTDGAMTDLDATLTSATGAFSSADVGRTVVVTGAGETCAEAQCGGAAVLTANIVSVTNGTTVELSAPAQTTVAGATVKIFNRDTNIKVTGGTWDRLTAGGDATGPTGVHGLVFRHVDRLILDDLRLKATQPLHTYGIAPGDVTDVVATRIVGMDVDAAIQFQGPANRLIVRDVQGVTPDDPVAFVARDYAGYADIVGDLNDIFLDGVNATSGMAMVKVLAGAGTKVRNVVIRNVQGTAGWAGIAITEDMTGVSDVGGILIDGVQLALAAGAADVNASITQGKDIIIRNIAPRTPTPSRTAIGLGSWESVVIDGFTMSSSYAQTGVVVVSVNGTVNDAIVRNIRISGAGSGVFNVAATKTVDRLSMSNIHIVAPAGAGERPLYVNGTVGSASISQLHMTNGSGIVLVPAGGTLTRLVVNGATLVGTGRLADFVNSTAIDVTLMGVVLDSPGADHFYLNGTGAVTIRGDSFVTLNSVRSGIELGGSWGGTLRIRNPDFPVSLPKTGLSVASAGDTFTNSNNGVAPGATRVVSDGSSWIAARRDGWTSVGQSGGGSKTIDAGWDLTRVSVSDATAFTITAPSPCKAGRVFEVQVYNSSGGVLGAITWSGFKFAGGAAPATPAASRNTRVTFRCDNGVIFETARAVDVSN